MQNWLIIENGVIIGKVVKVGNIVAGDFEGYYDTVVDDPSGKFAIGDSYTVEQWEQYNLTAEELYQRTIPQSITKIQTMRVLKANYLWEQFNAVLQSSQDALDEWQLATEVQRKNPFVIQLAPALGLSDTQMDQLFLQASTL